jgi:hypothetical protein
VLVRRLRPPTDREWRWGSATDSPAKSAITSMAWCCPTRWSARHQLRQLKLASSKDSTRLDVKKCGLKRQNRPPRFRLAPAGSGNGSICKLGDGCARRRLRRSPWHCTGHHQMGEWGTPSRTTFFNSKLSHLASLRMRGNLSRLSAPSCPPILGAWQPALDWGIAGRSDKSSQQSCPTVTRVGNHGGTVRPRRPNRAR